MQGGDPEKRGCRCWKSLLLHPTGGKERGIRGSEKGWRELKKSTSGGEGGESDQCWQLKSSDYNRREQRRGERMDQSSDGEYERREEKCRGSTAGWALRLSPGAQGTTAHSPTLSLTFFSHTFTSLFLSVWPRTLLGCRQPLAQPSFADSWDMIGWYSPALHCRWGTTSTPPHTHIHKPIWPKQHCSLFPLSVCRSPSRLPVIQQCFTYSYLHGNINAAVYCAIIRPYS